MILRFFFVLLAGVVLVGCGRERSADGGAGAPAKKRLAWVQPLKGHPVHQMTQIAFRQGCRDLGYEPLIIGTDAWDIGGTVSLAEQAIASGEVAGLAVWTGSPAWNPLVQRAARAGLPVVLPHFPAAEGSIPGATAIIGCDPAEYAAAAAREIGRAVQGTGSVAITQGSFNELENLVAAEFAKVVRSEFPRMKVLAPEEEGFDAPKAVSRAVSILQANPDLSAAFSTTGGGAVTWAGAQRGAGRKIVAIAMDYTRVNLDLVRDGSVHALVGQPLWDESAGAAQLLDRALRGEKLPWWTRLPAPIITRANLAPYDELLAKVEQSLK